jgi:hypothetical protein
MYAGIHAHSVRPHVMTHISAHVHLQPSLCVAKSYAYAHTLVCVHMYLYTCIYTYMCVCIHIYMYAYTFFGEYKLAPIHAL